MRQSRCMSTEPLRRITARVEGCSGEQAVASTRCEVGALRPRAAARRWASWASPARESRPSHVASRGWWSRIQGRSELAVWTSRPLGVRALRPMRRRMQMVFQDPYGSLNPRRKVGQLIAEGPIIHGQDAAKATRRARGAARAGRAGCEIRRSVSHEFSGGQRQRIGLARALALDPAILVADEPVSALDVSVQAQVLRLIADIRARFGLSVLFITHDLRVASQVCDSVAVMRNGEMRGDGTRSADLCGPAAPVYARAFRGSSGARLE